MKYTLVILVIFSVFALLNAQAETWHTYKPGGFPDQIVSNSGDIWVASSAGLMRFNRSTGERIQYDCNNTPYPSDRFTGLCFSSNGDLWACGFYGVLHYDGVIWQLYNSTNSILPVNQVHKVLPDANGGVWFATNSGMTYYHDGSWETFNGMNSTLPGSYTFNAMALHGNGSLWVATHNGVHCYNGEEWQMYDHTNSGLPASEIRGIAFDADGTGWFVSSVNVVSYDGAIWTPHNAFGGNVISNARGCFTDRCERLWIWSSNQLLMRENGIWQCFPISLFGDYSFGFHCMDVDEEQVLWLGLSDSYSPLSLASYDGVSVRRYPISEMPLASIYITSIFRGFDDKLWIGTSDEKGIGGYFSIENGHYDCYGMYNTDMPCDHVWALAQDSQLNMWVGTCIGLLKTGAEGSQIFQGADLGVNGWARTICPVGDGVWVGTSGGISRYENGNWNVLSSAEAGMDIGITYCIKSAPDGCIWISCPTGVLSYRDGLFTAYPDLPGARDFAFGSNGEVWIARGQLSKLQDGVWTHYDVGNSGLAEHDLRCVAVDCNQVVWAGTSRLNSKVYRFDGESWSSFDQTNSPFMMDTFNVIYVDEHNTKWFGGRMLHQYNEDGIPVKIDDPLVPSVSSALVYPNPFRETLNLRFDKMTDGHLLMSIYNIKGQQVWFQDYAQLGKGEQEISWHGFDQSGRKCAAGVYLIRMREKGQNRVFKALKVK